MNDPIWVIVPAAGRGVRAGLDVPKQFAMLGDVTVLERTVSMLVDMPGVGGIVVALPAHSEASLIDDDDLVFRTRQSVAAMGRQDCPVLFVDGGKTRQESVRNALSMVPEHVAWIAVHDACRPFCSKALFERVVRAAREDGAAVPGVSPTDTIKMVKRQVGPVSEPGVTQRSFSLVDLTPDRGLLMSVQTPQVFASRILREAHAAALNDGFTGTDDSQLVERLGYPVAVVEGERSNLKLTHPEDFRFAEILTGISASASKGFAVGLGFDIHPLVSGRACVIGGVRFDCEKGLAGHSDADVLCHAVMDGVLGALGKGDIGQWFPDSDPRYEGASSIALMREMWNSVKSEAEIVNVDAVVVAEAPRIMPRAVEIRENLAQALGCDVDRVSVKATTAEGLGSVGRGEGIVAFSVVMLRRR